jgi:hypothetical protein
MFRIVLYNLKEPEIKVTVCETSSKQEARNIMSRFRKGGWKVERRTNLDTLGDVALTFVEEK